jgi:hypothetical protein
MTINYLILAHANPRQVKKLVGALTHYDTWFYVHIDRKEDLLPYRDALSEFPNLYLLPDEERVRCTWGGMGIVSATLTMLRLIHEQQREGYAVLMSGQDYPIRSNEYIRRYFLRNRGTDFISCFSLPSPYWTNGGLDRLRRYKIDLSEKRGDFVQVPSVQSREVYRLDSLKKLAKVLVRKNPGKLRVLLQPKAFPTYLAPFGGDTWWALKTETTSNILAFVQNHDDLLTFMSHSNLPDEMVFQSIVRKLNKHYRGKILGSPTYANWSGMDEPSPRTFLPEDLLRLKNLPHGILFARKFDMDRFPELLETVDREIRGSLALRT